MFRVVFEGECCENFRTIVYGRHFAVIQATKLEGARQGRCRCIVRIGCMHGVYRCGTEVKRWRGPYPPPTRPKDVPILTSALQRLLHKTVSVLRCVAVVMEALPILTYYLRELTSNPPYICRSVCRER